ncbi:MAG: cytochrome P450 [Myxococcota bacterium]
MRDSSTGIAVVRSDVRPVPDLSAAGALGRLGQTRAFLGDWAAFLGRCRAMSGSSAFRVQVGGPVVAVTDGLGIRGIRDEARFGRIYGFGPRRPSPKVIGPVVPTMFLDGELHARRKQLHLNLYRGAWPALDGVLTDALDEAMPRWERGQVTLLAPELERIVARVLFRWLLGAEPPLADVRAVGSGVIPLRPTDAVPMPGDAKVRAAFERLVTFVGRCPRADAIAAAAGAVGIDPRDVARDLVFVLCMNGWAALSGAALSTVAELTRHPAHRDAIAADPGRVRDVVREVLRLHPPAPVLFAEAREDVVLETRTGDVQLRGGDVVMGVLAMAHRDPQVFADPDAFDPGRYAADPRLADEVLWTGGPDGLDPTPTDRTCAGRAAVSTILDRLVARIAEGRWALASRPEWGPALTPRNVPKAPLVLVAYRRAPAGDRWMVPARTASVGDRLRMGLVAAVRALQRRSVEVWSATTYRTGPRPGPAPRVAPTREVLNAPDIPPFLVVPTAMPRHGTMGLRYVAPYYGLAGALFGALERAGLDPRTPFRAGHPSLRRFPAPSEGWGNTQDDDAFARLRLQGPNPYLLRADPDGGGFVADYTRAFAGIAPPVVCRFERDGAALQPVSIAIDGRRFTPATDGWRRAKLVANALDARLTVFGEHLGATHLVIAQAFALARFQVPLDHPLRPALDLHAFATLQVNDFAYKLLVSPSSYFVRSGFVSRDQVFRLFRNAWPTTDAARLLPAQDVERRGLDAIPDHPYATEALPAWAALRRYTGRIVDGLYDGDAAVAGDPGIVRWDRALRLCLPRSAAELLPRPTTRSGLADLLAAWVFNNVSHEVCGDFSPYVSGHDEEQARLIDFDRLRMGMEGGPPSLAAVFLMKQGAYAGLFDTRGNSMVGVRPRAVTRCPTHAAALGALQGELRTLSTEVRGRNAARAVPFLRMDPRKWELSIGF